MTASHNRVILMGNLTRDPELRSTQTGTQVCKLGLAVNRKWKGQDDQLNESTCFVDLTAFGRQAEVISQYCTKGRPLFVEGRLEFNSWTGQDGQKRSKLEVVVEKFQLIGQKGDSYGKKGKAKKSDDDNPPDSEPTGFGESVFGETLF